MKTQEWKSPTQSAKDRPQGTRSPRGDESREDRKARALDHYRRAAKLARFFPNADRYDTFNPL